MKNFFYTLFILCLVQPTWATTFTVSNTNDAGLGSLREAITNANVDVSATAGSPHSINFTIGGQINMAGIFPVISNHMTINGIPAGNTLFRGGGGSYRILEISGAFTVELNNIKMENGDPGAAGVSGGGLLNNGGTVTLNNCILDGNITSAGSGGHGGGANNISGTLSINNSTIKNNTAGNGNGGGVYVQGGTVNLTNCTVQNNDCTVGGNGGGLGVATGGSLVLINCTVIGNSVAASTGFSSGGLVLLNTSSLRMTNTIIANNNNLLTPADYSVLGSALIFTNTNNIVERCLSTSCAIFASNADPNLAAVSLCGWQEVYKPVSPSFAINGGTTTGAPTADICGTNWIGGVDIGSVESSLPGSALDFDGATDFVSLPTAVSVSQLNEFTIEAWVNWDGTNNGCIYSETNTGSDNPMFSIIPRSINGGGMELVLRDNSNTGLVQQPTTGVIPTGTWTHVAIVRTSATNIRVYINGALTDNLFFTAPAAWTVNTINSGKRQRTLSEDFFDGDIDELRIWNKALCQSEITAQKDCELSGTETGLVAYYNFNQGAAGASNLTETTLTDASAASNDGTLTSFALTGTSSNWIDGSSNGVTGNCTPLTLPEIDVQGAGNSIASGDVTPSTTDGTDFGNVLTNLSRTFTIDNSAGTATLAIAAGSIIPFGGNATDFAISGITLPINIPAGTSTTFNVTFTPGALGLRSTTIFIGNNDCSESSYSFLVQGTGSTPPVASTLHFDGTDDEALNTTFQFANPANGFTIEFWANFDNFTGLQAPISQTSGNRPAPFDVSGSSNRLTFSYGNGLANGDILSPVLTAGCWYHFAMQYDPTDVGNEAKMFMNGALVASEAQAVIPANATPSGPNELMLGTRKDALTRLFGQLDDVRIWSSVRTPAQILANMNCELTGAESGLEVFYDLSESGLTVNGSNTGLSTITDKTGNGHNATLNNFALSGATSNWVAQTAKINATCTNDANEINLQGNSTNIVAGQTAIATTDDTDFGNVVDCGTNAVTKTFTIQNTGGVVLNITSIASSNTDFTISGVPTTVAAAGSETFTVTFDPTSQATHNATITIVNDDCDENPYTFSVEGVGISSVTDIVRGDALDFDGIDDEVIINNDASFSPSSGTISFECWAKSNGATWSGPDWAGLVSHRGAGSDLRALLGASGTSNIEFWIHNDRIIATVPDITQWHHYAGVYDGTNMYLYIDGVLAIQGTSAAGVIAFSDDLYIGKDNCCGNRRLNGSIDEVRVWNTARSANEIRENMHLTGSSCETDLVAYYQMNDGTGSTILTDKTGNGHNGTLTNMDPTTDWISSVVNVGNDAIGNSKSQTITVAAGTSTQNFTTANFSMDLLSHSGAEEFTVTYQEFTPNATTGIDAVTLYDNPMWTINKSTSTETFQANLNFTYAASPFTTIDPIKYGVYWRPMNSDGSWTKLGTPSLMTANSVQFKNASLAGQYMVAMESSPLVSDVRGNMYGFDGINDQLTIGNLGAVTDWTIETWFKPNGLNNYENIFHTIFPATGVSNNGVRLEISNNFASGHLYVSASGDGNFVPHTIVPLGGNLPNEWHHIALVGDQTNNRIYVYLNGVKVTDDAHTNWPADFPNLVIGRGFSSGSADRQFTGAVDEFKIWTSVRSESEIRENMHLTLKGNEANLLSYYQFNNDDPVGTVAGVKDATGSNDGTAENMASSAYLESEVAVAGGVSDRITVNAAGVFNFPNTGLNIEFGTDHPNGEMVIFRLETEKPHGWNTLTGDVDNEYFVIHNYGTVTTGLTPLVDMTFNRMNYISPSDVSTPQATNPIQVHKRASNAFGATWGTALGGVGADALTAGSNGMASFNASQGITEFSQFLIVNAGLNSDLPVDFLNFDAKRLSKEQVQLDWATASETNNHGFEIERMLEHETSFTQVGFVAGQGTIVNTSYYQQLDDNNYEGTSYYRLKQVDTDGSVEYSEIRAVSSNGSDGFNATIFPNPVKDQIAIRFGALPKGVTSAMIRVIGVDGKILHQFNADIQSYQNLSIDYVKELTPAMYMINVELDNGDRISQKFVKE